MTTAATIRQQIDDLLDTLSVEDQQRVLNFILSLHGAPQGIPGNELVEFFRKAPPEAIEAAREAYEMYRQERVLDSDQDTPSHGETERAG